MLFTAFVQAIQKSKYILLACCKTVVTPPYKAKHYPCCGMNPAQFASIFTHLSPLSPVLYNCDGNGSTQSTTLLSVSAQFYC